MSDADPILSFFPESALDKDPNILYTTLSITPTATSEEIRKAYRRAALKFHPDKHAGKGEEEKEEMGVEFRKVGFAFAVLSDESRRKRYDATGRTDEAFAGVEEMGWDAYFQSLFQRIDRKILDDDKAKYQGSDEELSDLKSAYISTSGSLPQILNLIPHSTTADETRFITIINSLITSKTLTSTPTWRKSSTDEAAAKKRLKKSEKEAKEAEEAAKEMGVWDEFYGSGKKGRRSGEDDAGKSKGKAKGKKSEDVGGEEDTLQALIMKRQRDRESGLNALEAKYRKIEEERMAKKRKGKKGSIVEEDNAPLPPEISDAEFEALQAKMFRNNDKKKEERFASKAENKRKSKP